jgi:hypothetical protein
MALKTLENLVFIDDKNSNFSLEFLISLLMSYVLNEKINLFIDKKFWNLVCAEL